MSDNSLIYLVKLRDCNFLFYFFRKRLDCFILNRSIENAENYSSEDEGEAMITGGARVERKVCLFKPLKSSVAHI